MLPAEPRIMQEFIKWRDTTVLLRYTQALYKIRTALQRHHTLNAIVKGVVLTLDRLNSQELVMTRNDRSMLGVRREGYEAPANCRQPR